LRNRLFIEQSGDLWNWTTQNTTLGAARFRLDQPWRKWKRRLKIGF